MTRKELIEQIREKQSFLCVGLDTDLDKMPKGLKEMPHLLHIKCLFS